MVTKQVAGKMGELYVFNELLKRGAVPYVPLVDEGVAALVRTPKGQVIELQIKSAGSAGGKDPRWFQMPNFEPRNNFFIVGVEARNSEPGDVWVFPSAVFDKYAGAPKGKTRDLNLDIRPRNHDLTLRDLLCGFRNRWELIVNYEEYESRFESSENLEDLLTMREALEAPEEESFTLEEYERSRSTTLPD